MMRPPKNPRYFCPRYILEAVPVFLFYGLCAVLPLGAASGFGGWLARTIGPLMGVSRRAENNLRRAMPELDSRQRRRIIRGMWDNLGRVAAEYPHMAAMFASGRIGGDHAEALRAMRAQNKGGLIISGHLGNWELGALVSGAFDVPMAVLYRAPNNPYVDWLIRRARLHTAGQVYAKGATGTLGLMRHLRAGGYSGILIDQKLNEGIMVPFFGLPAATTTAPAEMAMRFGLPIIVARVVRLQGARFAVECRTVAVPRTADRRADAVALTTALTAQLEVWIREHPEQWLWLHNRWPKAEA